MKETHLVTCLGCSFVPTTIPNHSIRVSHCKIHILTLRQWDLLFTKAVSPPKTYRNSANRLDLLIDTVDEDSCAFSS